MEEFDAIIIGSGAGGMATAICLARAGQKVLVLEQHYVPGGWCHSFFLKGQRFSPGVHYIGLIDEGQSVNQLYEGLGVANDLVFFSKFGLLIDINHLEIDITNQVLFANLLQIADRPLRTLGTPGDDKPKAETTKLFVNRGKQGGLTEEDLNWALTEGAVLPAEAIHSIRVLDRFSFVEVAADQAERAVEYLDGTKLKGKQIRMEIARS